MKGKRYTIIKLNLNYVDRYVFNKCDLCNHHRFKWDTTNRKEMDMQVPSQTISGFRYEVPFLFILYDTSLGIYLPSSDKGIDINNIYISTVNCIFHTDYKGFYCAF